LIIALRTLHWVEGVKWEFLRWWGAGVVALRSGVGELFPLYLYIIYCQVSLPF
jgi:hypothetical protein